MRRILQAVFGAAVAAGIIALGIAVAGLASTWSGGGIAQTTSETTTSEGPKTTKYRAVLTARAEVPKPRGVRQGAGGTFSLELTDSAGSYSMAWTLTFRKLTGRAQAGNARRSELDRKFSERTRLIREQRRTQTAAGLPPEAVVRTTAFNLTTIEYEFWGERFRFGVPAMFLLSFIVGVIGGTYGIGGGAIIAPFCVAVFHLPVYTIAGAALMGTFITSVAGALFFSVIPATGGVSAMPDWPLGILFGVGGFVGMYLGARFQKFVPQKYIKLMLGLIIISVAVRYILQYLSA